ncbi:transcriptional regulator [Psychrobacillus sp. FSL K6-1415]|uniref:transcriptional regulator n=1 Tax=Psychrobacillus sp. FSL K6-1415 TaxID=2921544 RepID=UPI0030F5A0AD
MLTRIAVLGSATFIERLRSFEHELPSTRLDYYTYNIPFDAKDIIPTIKPCDAVFFSGSFPFTYAKDSIARLPIPTFYLKQDENAIMTTLLSLSLTNPTAVHKLSIDLVHPEGVKNVLEDIGLTDQTPFLMKIDTSFDLEEIVAFHTVLQKNGATLLAITSIHAVYQRLRDNGLSVIRMIDPKSSIIKAIEDTKSLALLFKSQSAKIAVGYIQTNKELSIAEEKVKQIAASIQANTVKEADNLYTLFSTQGDVQEALNNNLITSWINSSPAVKIAFGYGKTVLEATQNARDALSYATDNTAYLLTDSKELLGPYPYSDKQVLLKNVEPQFVQIAKETTLSPANLSKVIQFSRSRKSTEFTAYDLEVYLQVSRRTTERILKKLADHGYAQIIGEEMTYQQGRPRAIYELNFPTYN